MSGSEERLSQRIKKYFSSGGTVKWWNKKPNYAVVALFTAGLLVRVVLDLQVVYMPGRDAYMYFEIARNFASGRGLSVNFVWQYHLFPKTILHAEDTYALLYPLVLGALLKLFGESIVVARASTLMINWLSILPLYLITKKVFGFRTAMLTVFLTMFSAHILAYSVVTMSESLFILLLNVIFYLLIRIETMPSRTQLMTVGVLLGLLYLTRYLGILVVVSILLYLWFFNFRRTMRKDPIVRRFVGVTYMLVAFFLVVSPLLLRNYLEFGNPFYNANMYAPWLSNWDDFYRISNPTVSSYFSEHSILDLLTRWARINYGQIAGLLRSCNYMLVFFSPFIALGLIRHRGWKPQYLMHTMAVFTLGYTGLHWDTSGRFLVVFLPLYLMFAASAIVWIIRSLELFVGRYYQPKKTFRVIGKVLLWALVVLVITSTNILLVAGDVQATNSDRRIVALQTAGTWIRDNTERNCVIMSREAIRLNYFAERPTIMIPREDLATIMNVARRYNASYLLLEPVAIETSPSVSDLYEEPKDREGLELVYSSNGGRRIVIYRILH